MTMATPKSVLLDAVAADVVSAAAFGSVPSIRCCCGRDECAFLRHSSSVLESVEKDVHTAAKLGKALLARHEAYMADAERDRLELTARIEQLEMDKQDLQAENARTVEENRNLLDQLELLNSTVQDSDTRIQSLEATLQSSQQAVRRLENAVARAADMERHIALLEQEQMKLQNTLITSESEARSAMQRWKKADRGICDLQDQLERMEREATEERERHVEVLGRMERQREMEKELNTAAGRLKGAAAAKSLNTGKNGSSVVSHFVRDLLQDNASLQLGIAELREMLMNSNDEIQALREELMYHQPVAEAEASAASTLRAEIEPAMVSQELHIHHHYHVSPKPEPPKSRKKRRSLTPGIFTPPSMSTASSPSAGPWRLSPSPAAPALLTHAHKDSTSTLSVPPSNRWSVFSDQPSEFAPSSVPSSPRSIHRNSMFDPHLLDNDPIGSPTTSVDPSSPTWRVSHRKRASEISSRSIPLLTPLLISPRTPTFKLAHQPISDPIEEDLADEVEDVPYLSNTTDDSTAEESTFSKDEEIPRPRLHRAVSHESIMSLSGGLDIHTLKARPSQLTMRPLGGAEAVVTGITARSTISRGGEKRSSVVLRNSLAGLPTPRIVSTPAMGESRSSNLTQSSGGRGLWTGWRPWGGTTSTPTPPKRVDNPKEKDKDLLRAPGINQAGAIPGFQEYWAAHKRRGAPSKVLPDIVDADSLREVLEE